MMKITGTGNKLFRLFLVFFGGSSEAYRPASVFSKGHAMTAVHVSSRVKQELRNRSCTFNQIQVHYCRYPDLHRASF